jgi:tripartite-type tricarboxylate transporter receptor subunit TctC
MRRAIIGAIAAAGIFAALIGAVHAQATDTYPDRSIKLVVPAAAGGVTDTPARIVTNRMRDNLGQTIAVENQGGAGGILAAENVKRASPDGYTLLYVNAATHGLLPALKKSMPYDAMKDFVPIVMAVRAPCEGSRRSVEIPELRFARSRQYIASDRPDARPGQQDTHASRALSR